MNEEWSKKVSSKSRKLQRRHFVCFIYFRVTETKWRLWSLCVLELTFFDHGEYSFLIIIIRAIAL